MFYRHGQAGKDRTTEYRAWEGMKTRCYNPASPNYKDYGGRGITVCKRWRDSFTAFFTDMGPKPSRVHSLDRKDNSKGYSPSNCRWATHLEQQQNTRFNHNITAFGETLVLSEWARRRGIEQTALSNRIKAGRSPEEALTTPSRKRFDPNVTAFGETRTLSDWARHRKIPVVQGTVHHRIFILGWNPEVALTALPHTRKQSTKSSA